MRRSPELSIENVAVIMQKDPQTIRWGIQQRRWDWGSYIENPHSGRKSFHIVPNKFYDYMGMTKEQVKDILDRKEKIKNENKNNR